MFGPQGYDLKELEPIGHLLAVPPPFTILLEVGGLLTVICGINDGSCNEATSLSVGGRVSILVLTL
nr:hypothetical protein JUJ52_03475 [Virgibacillus sp. AGTR]